MYGGQERWHHVECFAKLRNELQFFEAGDALPGFEQLKKEDKEIVLKALPKIEALVIFKNSFKVIYLISCNITIQSSVYFGATAYDFIFIIFCICINHLTK